MRQGSPPLVLSAAVFGSYPGTCRWERGRARGVRGVPSFSESSSARSPGMGGRGCSPSIQRRTRVASVAICRCPARCARAFTLRASSPLDRPLAWMRICRSRFPGPCVIDATSTLVRGKVFVRHGSRPSRYWFVTWLTADSGSAVFRSRITSSRAPDGGWPSISRRLSRVWRAGCRVSPVPCSFWLSWA